MHSCTCLRTFPIVGSCMSSDATEACGSRHLPGELMICLSSHFIGWQKSENFLLQVCFGGMIFYRSVLCVAWPTSFSDDLSNQCSE